MKIIAIRYFEDRDRGHFILKTEPLKPDCKWQWFFENEKTGKTKLLKFEIGSNFITSTEEIIENKFYTGFIFCKTIFENGEEIDSQKIKLGDSIGKMLSRGICFETILSYDAAGYITDLEFD